MTVECTYCFANLLNLNVSEIQQFCPWNSVSNAELFEQEPLYKAVLVSTYSLHLANLNREFRHSECLLCFWLANDTLVVFLVGCQFVNNKAETICLIINQYFILKLKSFFKCEDFKLFFVSCQSKLNIFGLQSVLKQRPAIWTCHFGH